MASLGGVTAKLAIVAAILAVAAVAAAPGSASSSRTGAHTTRFFSPSGPWNEPLSAGAPLDPSSSALVGGLAAEVAAEQAARRGPWINTTSYSVPIYTVPATQPTVAVRLDHAPEPALSGAWRAVPLPSTARPASGTDRDLVVWQPSTRADVGVLASRARQPRLVGDVGRGDPARRAQPRRVRDRSVARRGAVVGRERKLACHRGRPDHP